MLHNLKEESNKLSIFQKISLDNKLKEYYIKYYYNILLYYITILYYYVILLYYIITLYYYIT